MRKLNLLKQILKGWKISKERHFSPHSFNLWVELNIINNYRGWKDTITITKKEFMTDAGYTSPRYARDIFDTFIRECTDAGLLRVISNHQEITIEISDLTELEKNYTSYPLGNPLGNPLGSTGVTRSVTRSGLPQEACSDANSAGVKYNKNKYKYDKGEVSEKNGRERENERGEHAEETAHADEAERADDADRARKNLDGTRENPDRPGERRAVEQDPKYADLIRMATELGM